MYKLKNNIHIIALQHYQRLPDFLKHYISRMVFRPRRGKRVCYFGNVLFGPKVEIDDYTYIYAPANISNVKIGKYCSIAKGLSIITSNHRIDNFSTYAFFHQINSPLISMQKKSEKSDLIDLWNTRIGNDVWIGTNVTIMGGIVIGDGAVIGASSVVTKDIPPYAIAVGIPAKIVKYRFSEERIEQLQKLKWWDFDQKTLYERYEELSDSQIR